MIEICEAALEIGSMMGELVWYLAVAAWYNLDWLAVHLASAGFHAFLILYAAWFLDDRGFDHARVTGDRLVIVYQAALITYNTLFFAHALWEVTATLRHCCRWAYAQI